MQVMTLDEIHEAELYVLKEVDALCRKIGIKYWVMFGTLIGAVREQGFIPWDDDLDIVVKRDDYDKLLAYFTQWGGGYSVRPFHRHKKLSVLYCPHIRTKKLY